METVEEEEEEEEEFGANKYASLAALNILMEAFQSVEELESLHPRVMKKKANDILNFYEG